MHAGSTVRAQLPDKNVALTAACTSKEAEGFHTECPHVMHSILDKHTCCHKVACPVNCFKWTRKVCSALNDGGEPARVRLGRTWEEGFDLAAMLPCVVVPVLEAD